RAGVDMAELYRTAKHRGARGDTGLRSRRRGLGHATRLTHFAPQRQHALLRSLTQSGGSTLFDSTCPIDRQPVNCTPAVTVQCAFNQSIAGRILSLKSYTQVTDGTQLSISVLAVMFRRVLPPDTGYISIICKTTNAVRLSRRISADPTVKL